MANGKDKKAKKATKQIGNEFNERINGRVNIGSYTFVDGIETFQEMRFLLDCASELSKSTIKFCDVSACHEIQTSAFQNLYTQALQHTYELHEKKHQKQKAIFESVTEQDIDDALNLPWE